MNARSRVWIIDGGDAPELTSIGDPLAEAPRPAQPAPRRSPLRRPLHPATAPRPAGAAAVRPRRALHSAMLLVLGYLLGPAGLLLSSRGRRSGAWVVLAAGWLLLTALAAVGWWAVTTGLAGANLMPWLTAATPLAVLAGFTLWARALHLLVATEPIKSHVWSPRLTRPWSAVVLGLLAPGSAQVLARRPRRAVVTLWHAWPAVAAVLALLQAPMIWRQREVFAAWGLDGAALETALLAAVAVAALAPLLWLAQALEGGRVLAARAGRWQGMRGDWAAVALAATVAVALVVAEPATIAAALGEYADGFAGRGCTVAPLLLVRTAQRLDPAQPAYALQAADLYAAAGAVETARQVRADLDRTLQPYLGALLRERRGAMPVPAATVKAAGARPAAAAVPEPLLLPPAPAADQPSGPPRPAGVDTVP